MPRSNANRRLHHLLPGALGLMPAALEMLLCRDTMTPPNLKRPAAIRLLLGIAACCLVVAGCGEEQPSYPRPHDVGSDPIEVVEAWLDARNAGDYPRMASLMSGEAFDNPFASRAEVEAASALHRVITPGVCTVNAQSESLGAFVACDVTVTDIIVEAAGVTARNLNDSTFRVRDGFIIAAPEWIPSSQIAEAAIEDWATEHRWFSYKLACPAGIAGQSSIDGKRCARFIAKFHADWRPVVASLGLDDG